MDDRAPLFKRINKDNREEITFMINGRSCSAYVGDTVMTAILCNENYLHLSEFNKMPRAGFCLIGACQDCYVELIDGSRIRACSTLLEQDMHFVIGKVDEI